MKKILLSVVLISSGILCHSQQVGDLHREFETIELTISTPQPRLKETFQISLDIDHIRANIFKSLAGQVRVSDDLNSSASEDMVMRVTAVNKGKSEIGPLVFTVDNTTYTTNKISYEVIDALPDTDRGVWFRKITTGENNFCIIIEQRIPAEEKTISKADKSIVITTEPEIEEILKFKDTYSIAGLSGGSSQVNTGFSNVEINGEDRQFMYGYSIYYFTITDRHAKIRITKDNFQNIPTGYKFEDIIIQ